MNKSLLKKIGRNHTIPPCKIITAYALKYTFWKHFPHYYYVPELSLSA